MTNKKNIIKLIQIRVKDDKFKESPLVVNSDYFVRASLEELPVGTIPIIGQTRPEFLTQVSLSNGDKPFVRETPAQVYTKIGKAGK